MNVHLEGNWNFLPGALNNFQQWSLGYDKIFRAMLDAQKMDSQNYPPHNLIKESENKYRLELENDIAQMNLIFPNTSGNFLLVCHILGGGGGDHDVTAWKVWEHDESAATTTDVMWAGGSVPAFTSGSATDIVSFYWDADEQQAYGTASLAFATP